MINLNRDIIRQLNNLYGLKFKQKYKNEIKVALKLIIKNMFKDISFENIDELKEYIELNNFDITIIKNKFFQEKKFLLLEQLNPIWYKEEYSEYKATKREADHFKAVILNELLKEDIYKDPRIKMYLIHESDSSIGNFFYMTKFDKENQIPKLKHFIKKYLNEKKYKFIEREIDYISIKDSFIKISNDIKNRRLNEGCLNFNQTKILNKEIENYLINNEFEKINLDLNLIEKLFIIDLYNLTALNILIEKIENKINSLKKESS